jgi:hypothetical protein
VTRCDPTLTLLPACVEKELIIIDCETTHGKDNLKVDTDSHSEERQAK